MSYYCYKLGCIIHKLVEFNAYSVVLRVSCRPIVYYCILLSLRSVKDEIGHVIVVLCCVVEIFRQFFVDYLRNIGKNKFVVYHRMVFVLLYR